LEDEPGSSGTDASGWPDLDGEHPAWGPAPASGAIWKEEPGSSGSGASGWPDAEAGPLAWAPGSPGGPDGADGPPEEEPLGAGWPGAGGEPPGGEPHGVELVIESRDWYLGQNEKLFRILLLIGSVLILSLLANGWLILSRPEPRYFGVTRDLRILETPPLSEAVVGNPDLANWAGNVVARSLSLNFLTWRQTLSDVRPDFDPDGFGGFLASLRDGGHLEKMERGRLSLSCQVSGAPVVTDSALRGGIMTWRLEMPLVLSYESSTGVVASQRLLAEVVVQRTRTTVNPRGVAIRQVILSRAG
jgi:intracellular multiplication protein IcmL